MLKRILTFVVAVILVAGYMPVQAEDEQNGAALFDFDRLNLSEGKDDITATLREAMSGIGDSDKTNPEVLSELAVYISLAMEKYSQGKIKAKNGIINVNEAGIKEAYDDVLQFEKIINDMLKEFKITLNKQLDYYIKINTDEEMEKQINMQLYKSVLQKITGISGVELSFDAGSVYFPVEMLHEAFNVNDNFFLQISKVTDNKYKLVFVNPQGQVMDKVDSNIRLSLPAVGEFSNILAYHSSGNDMIGGQYNPNTNTIEFYTKFSGEYEIIENIAELDDIAHLDEDYIQAINFMVSKGYIDADGSLFEPDKEINRGDFVTMLVRIFFALDTSLQTKFTDVDKDQPIYPYVASAEHGNILSGIDKETFGADVMLTKVQIIALCSNVLKEKKGYFFPVNTEEILSVYSDTLQIPSWSRGAVAFAVREDFLPETDAFNPDEIITKKDAALYLHKLFMMLYEVRPELKSGSGDGSVQGVGAQKEIDLFWVITHAGPILAIVFFVIALILVLRALNLSFRR